MRQFLLLLMIAAFATASCASKQKPALDKEGIKKRADESHKNMGTY
jgi:hypothetical protein